MRRFYNSIIFVSAVTVLGVSSVIGGIGYLQYNFTKEDAFEKVNAHTRFVRQALIEDFSAADFADINTKDDMTHPSYRHLSQLLNTIRIAGGLRYLYTAKINGLGEYIYVVDGLDPKADDFAAPGTPIEPELFEYMRAGLRGEVMISNEIMETEWGPVATAYYPIMLDGSSEILGILCMEFDMHPLKDALHKLTQETIAIGIFANIMALVLVLLFFIKSRKSFTLKLRQTEKRAGEAASVLLYITERAEVGVLVLSLDEDVMLICNEEFQRIYNIPSEKLDFERFLRLSERMMPPGEYRELCARLRALSKLPNNSDHMEFHIQHDEKDKSFLTIKGAFRELTTDLGERMLVLTLEDVTEANYNEKVKAFERGMFRDALIASSTSTILLDLNAGIVTREGILKLSPRTTRFFPVEKLPMKLDLLLDTFCRVTKPLDDIGGVRTETSVSSLLGAYQRGIKHFTNRYTFTHANINFTLRVLLSENPADGHVYACFMSYDLSDAKPKTDHTTFVNANQTVAYSPSFIERIIQEVSSPVLGMINMLDLVDHSRLNAKQSKKIASILKSSAQRVLNFVSNVVYFRQLNSNNFEFNREAVSIEHLFNECVDAIKTRAQDLGITCIINNDCVFKYPVVYTSRSHLRQIIMNLAENALRNNKENGLIIFELHNEDEPDPSRQACRFSIKDTGIGMSEKFLENIFVSGTTNGNNGLGLPVVKGLLDALNGHLRLVSTEGDGTVAEFVLSFEGAPEGNSLLETPPEDLLAGMHILVAEDNALRAAIVSHMLEGAGAKLTLVNNGATAVDTMFESEPGHFNAILMESHMPLMDGFTATRRIRASGHVQARTIPIIALTSRTSKKAISEIEEAGMNDYIVKTADRIMVVQKLNYWRFQKVDMPEIKEVVEVYEEPTRTPDGHRVINLTTPTNWTTKKKDNRQDTKAENTELTTSQMNDTKDQNDQKDELAQAKDKATPESENIATTEIETKANEEPMSNEPPKTNEEHKDIARPHVNPVDNDSSYVR